VSQVPPDQAPTINASGTAKVETVTGGRRIYIGFEQKCDAPGCKEVKDVRVRQALNMAVDVQGILDGLFGKGVAVREGGMVNPPAKNPEVKAYPYDPEGAKKLLAEAGYPDCFSATLATPNGRYQKDKDIAQAVAADLNKIGCNIEVVPYEWSAYVPMIRSKELPALFLLGSGSDFLSAWYDLSDLNSVDASTNYVNWQNDEWDQLVKQLTTTYDPAERKKITDRLQVIVHEQAPWLFIYMQVDWYAVADNVNWTPRADEIMDFRSTTFK
jgi:peptide/nickel transport system substrate-binding protein